MLTSQTSVSHTVEMLCFFFFVYLYFVKFPPCFCSGGAFVKKQAASDNWVIQQGICFASTLFACDEAAGHLFLICLFSMALVRGEPGGKIQRGPEPNSNALSFQPQAWLLPGLGMNAQ